MPATFSPADILQAAIERAAEGPFDEDGYLSGEAQDAVRKILALANPHEDFEDEYHGPEAPGPGWVQSGTGPHGGKIWKKQEDRQDTGGDTSEGKSRSLLGRISGKLTSGLKAGVTKALHAIDDELKGGGSLVVTGLKTLSPSMVLHGLSRAITSAYGIGAGSMGNAADALEETWEQAMKEHGGSHFLGVIASKVLAAGHTAIQKGIGKLLGVRKHDEEAEGQLPPEVQVAFERIAHRSVRDLLTMVLAHAQDIEALSQTDREQLVKSLEDFAGEEHDTEDHAEYFEEVYHGPEPPGDGWVAAGTGPRGGKMWKKGPAEGKAPEAASGGKSFEKAKATKGRMMEAVRVGKGAEAKVVLKNGQPAPEHIKPAMVPPDWSQVQVSLDPHAELLVTGADSKGRPKAVYSDAHDLRTAAVKFARVDEMIQQGPLIDKQIQEARSNPKTKDAADCAWLMSVQATRPGSETDTGADVKAYGATTLEGRHVIQTKEGVRLQFVGKEGVHHDHLVNDKELSKMLLERKAKAGDKGKLFGVNEGQVNRFIGKLDGGHFSAKDFRTRRANLLAVKAMARFEGSPQTDEQRKSRIMAVAKMVSYKLGNKPEQCLESYINPAVFSSWQVAK